MSSTFINESGKQITRTEVMNSAKKVEDLKEIWEEKMRIAPQVTTTNSGWNNSKISSYNEADMSTYKAINF